MDKFSQAFEAAREAVDGFRDSAGLPRITDERGGVYRVNTRTRTVVS